MQLEHAIWWQVYPVGFAGAPIRDRHPESETTGDGLRRLIGWLDYAVQLGANGLLLGPIFHSATHGYDTLDHTRIDARLGTDDDFDALVAAANQRGVGLLLDGVFNHVGRDHPAFHQALADGPGSPAAQAFQLEWVDGVAKPRVFEGHGDLVALDLASDAGRQLCIDVMCHWLERGISGWRLDAAYAVPAEQWRPILDAVRQRHPEAIFVGEVIHGDYAEILATSGMDSVTQYELWKAIWSSLRDANFYELAHALGRHEQLLERFIPLTFVGNHDVTRIASMVGAERAALALVVLLTVGGSPCVYYGDERGYEAVKEERWGGDDAVRPAYPSTPVELDPSGAGVYDLHRGLIALRRRHPWLATAVTQVGELSNQRITYRSVSRDEASAGGGRDRAWIEVELDVSGERPGARVVGPAGELWVV